MSQQPFCSNRPSSTKSNAANLIITDRLSATIFCHLNSHSTIISVRHASIFISWSATNAALILILSNDEHSSSNTSTFKGCITSIIHTLRRTVGSLSRLSTTHFLTLGKVFNLETIEEIICFNIRE